MAISTNPKPMIYRNLYEDTAQLYLPGQQTGATEPMWPKFWATICCWPALDQCLAGNRYCLLLQWQVHVVLGALIVCR